MRIILFSRPIRSGKTTELTEWCKQQPNIDGILMPDINGLRCMQRISTAEIWEAEISSPTATDAVLKIGRFFFYRDAFARANQILMNAPANTNCLVIDEIGKLELMKQGFDTAVRHLLSLNDGSILLLVVRDVLLQEVIEFYQLKNYTVVNDLSAIDY